MGEVQQRVRKTFLELMETDGVYPSEQKTIAYVKRRLTEAGVAFEDDAFGNIIAKVPGTGPAVMLSTHVDIPESAPDVKFTEEGDVIRAAGSNILGADPKTGLAVLVEFLSDLQRQDRSTHSPVEALLTRGEETGLLGARNADYSKITAQVGLVLDEDGPVTQVVTQAPAFVRIDAEFKGRVVHPREPEKGINALMVASRALNRLPWGYIADGVTWNVGIFESGTARNSVPGSAKLQAELRSYDTELVVSQAERVEREFLVEAKEHGAESVLLRELEFEGYRLDRSHPLFERLEKTFSEMNLKPNYFATFGGSDANIFNARGITCVPIGSGYYDAHQYTESANTKDMAEIHAFLDKFVRLP